MSPEIAGFFDTGKYYNWERGFKNQFSLLWFNILLRSSRSLPVKAARRRLKKKKKTAKKQVTSGFAIHRYQPWDQAGGTPRDALCQTVGREGQSS